MCGSSRLLPALLAAACLAPSLAALASGAVLEDLAYGGDPAQTLDLYLPDTSDAEAGAPPPLVVFVHSRLFDRADRPRDVARRFARPLQREGLAVAVVRHRLAPAHRHPDAAEDVAAAIAWLSRAAGEHGYDAKRITLAGRSSGAHLAALVALDRRYLEAHELSPQRIRAVAGWSGIYDLDPPDGAVDEQVKALYEAAFGGRRARRAASPVELVRQARKGEHGPTFLLLVAEHDLPDARRDAEAFSQALRDAGDTAAETFMVARRDHMSMLDLDAEGNEARRLFFALLGIDEPDGSIEEIYATRRFWRDPSFSVEGFWEQGDLVRSHDADARFLETLNMPFAQPGVPPRLRALRYHAIDLLEWVARHVPGGDGPGDFLTLTNVRGEQVVWRRSELRAYDPVIVVGLDDERALFEVTTFYHTKRRYSWTQPEAERWVLARTLGAFVHFREPPPDSIDPRLFGRFGLEPGAFTVSEQDPLAPLDDLPEPERRLLTQEFRCVSCHRFRGVGARAGHLRARDGALVGGFGLPLEEYPPQVWRRYCFEQAKVADEIGANVVPLGEHAPLLFELVEREQKRKRAR